LKEQKDGYLEKIQAELDEVKAEKKKHLEESGSNIKEIEQLKQKSLLL